MGRLFLVAFFIVLVACGDATGPKAALKQLQAACAVDMAELRASFGEPDTIVVTQGPGDRLTETWTYERFRMQFRWNPSRPDTCPLSGSDGAAAKIETPLTA